MYNIIQTISNLMPACVTLMVDTIDGGETYIAELRDNTGTRSTPLFNNELKALRAEGPTVADAIASLDILCGR